MTSHQTDIHILVAGRSCLISLLLFDGTKGEQ